MSYSFQLPEPSREVALRRRLTNLQHMPFPAQGRDSKRRAREIIETLTAYQNARYVARLHSAE